jgi:hypothetical protein
VLGLVFNRAKLPGKGNLYAGPVGGWAVPHGGRLQKVKDPVFPVTTRETKNGSSSNKKAVSGDQDDRLAKAT